jgi:hypothetical protein
VEALGYVVRSISDALENVFIISMEVSFHEGNFDKERGRGTRPPNICYHNQSLYLGDRIVSRNYALSVCHHTMITTQPKVANRLPAYRCRTVPQVSSYHRYGIPV